MLPPGPWASYDVIACASNPERFYEYTPFNLEYPYLNGTLAGDTCNAGFPFDDLWDQPPANGIGYSHIESK